jgi:hypothetical protein
MSLNEQNVAQQTKMLMLGRLRMMTWVTKQSKLTDEILALRLAEVSPHNARPSCVYGQFI